MLNEKEFHTKALEKLVEIKGKDYVLENKEYLYPCWHVYDTTAYVSILFDDTNTGDLFDSEGNLHVDETIKPKERFDFEVDLTTGECIYVN